MRAATATGWKPPSAPATSRSTSTWSWSPAPRRARTSSRSVCVAPLERHLFSRDERPVEELVLDLCREHGLTLATAESCTGGHGRRAAHVCSRVERRVPRRRSSRTPTRSRGASSASRRMSCERHGAVSAEAAAAMAAGRAGPAGRRRRAGGHRDRGPRRWQRQRSPSGSSSSTRKDLRLPAPGLRLPRRPRLRSGVARRSPRSIS